MYAKIIKPFLILMLVMSMNQQILGAVHVNPTITAASGTISVLNDSYVNNRDERWAIDNGTNLPIKITFSADLEFGFDWLSIYTIDEYGIRQSIAFTADDGHNYSSCTVSTVIPNGKAWIEFHSDISCSNDEGYTGFTLSYSVDNSFSVSENSYIKGTISVVGNMGIGILNPIEKLHVNGSVRGNGTDGALKVQTDVGYAEIGPSFRTDQSAFIFNKPIFLCDGKIDTYPNLSFQTYSNTRMTILGNGNIGIGTTTPQYKLDVKGVIRATEVLVQSVDSFPDFVFDDEYSLPKLAEVNHFIQTNGHLPNIPSAVDVKENGMSLVDMQLKLLQKVEELTLYLIDQKKKIDFLEQKIGVINKK